MFKYETFWQVGVAVSADGVFQQVSYVNAICTIKGGTHVECVANQVITKLLPVLKRKNKSEVRSSPATIQRALVRPLPLAVCRHDFDDLDMFRTGVDSFIWVVTA